MYDSGAVRMEFMFVSKEIRRVLTLVLTLCLIISDAAHGSALTPERADAAALLRKTGFVFSDEWLEDYAREAAAFDKMLRDMGWDSSFGGHTEAYDMLQFLGSGPWSDEKEEYIPVSDQVYAFDAEVMDIENMYTVFLTRVNLIIPDAAIGDIREDMSGLDENLEGRRSVTFSLDGREYTWEFESLGDWLNMDIVDRLNGALKEAGCKGRLHVVSDDVDQIVTLVYGDDAWAKSVRAAISTSDLTKNASLTDLLRGLFGR